MLIENQPLQLNKNISLDRLSLTDLQKQYLTYLASGDSLQQLVQRLLKNGWLVNFQELFKLMTYLVAQKIILNSDIVSYFNKYLSDKTLSQLNLNSQTLTAETSVQIPTQNILSLPFFRMLPQELALSMIKNAKYYKVPIDYLLTQQGSSSQGSHRHLIVLIQGQVAIYKNQNGGRQFLSLAQAPAVLAESSFLLGTPKTADIIATQSCLVLSIPYDEALLSPLINQNKANELLKRFWIQNALSASDFFKNIPADCLDALTFSGRILSLEDNQTLFKQNEPSHAAYLVIQGQIRITQNEKFIAQMNQGSFFGEISLTMTNGLRTASATSFGKTLLLEITRDQFYNLLGQNLFLAKEIQNLALQRLSKDHLRQ